MPEETPDNPDQIPAAVEVTLTFPVSQLLDAYVADRQTPRWDDEGPGPRVSDEIKERVAQLLVKKIEAEALRAAREMIDPIVGTIIAKRVEALLEVPIQPTNEFGRAVGQGYTLMEMIARQIKEFFSPPTTYRRDRSQFDAGKLIEQAVAKAIKEDVEGALKAARAEVTQKLRDAAAEAMAETIKKL